MDAITHHVEEEEKDLLPGMRERMDESELNRLADRFSAVRGDLLGEQPDDVTKEQLVQQAKNIDLEGASGKDKAELKADLKQEAEL